MQRSRCTHNAQCSLSVSTRCAHTLSTNSKSRLLLSTQYNETTAQLMSHTSSRSVPSGSGQEPGQGLDRHLLGEVARPLRRVEDLIVEDREIEGQAEPDRVRRRKVNQSDVLRAAHARQHGHVLADAGPALLSFPMLAQP